MGLRGRDNELAAIGELVSATTRGAGGVLLVEGAPGIGKTRLLAEAAAIAGRAGLRQVSAEAFESQRAVPFATLLTALLDGRLWRADTAPKAPELGFWLIEEIHDVLEAAALDGPLMVALDDLHSADAGTLLALRTLVPRTAELPILWSLSLRPRSPALRELTGCLGRARRIVLRPLSDDAVAEVVADHLEAAGEPALLELAAHARGNPFLLVELLEGLREEGRVQVDDGLARVIGDELPRRMAESMRERLDRLSADACQVVRVAAVLGTRFTAEQLAAVLDRRPSQLLEPIAETLRMDLLSEAGERLGFRHELLRQAVLRTLPRSVLRGLRREAAGVLLEHGAEAVQVAAQLADSAEPGDVVAIEQLRRAAHTLATTDAAAAADMSVRALELTPPGHADHSALVAEAMAALHAAMRDEEASRLAASVLDGTLPDEEEAEIRLSLSSRLIGRDLLCAEENRRALRLDGISPRLRAQHLGWLGCTLRVVELLLGFGEHAGFAWRSPRCRLATRARRHAGSPWKRRRCRRRRTWAPTFPPPPRSDGSRRSPARRRPTRVASSPYAVPAVPSDPAMSAHVVRIGLAAGESELARSALTRAEAVERANPGVRLLAGVAAHARGLLARDVSELARAADLLADGGRPLPHASALEDAGRALGDVDRLASALELYNTAGATADAARVAMRLRALGVRQATGSRRPTEGWESLTESELRVVRLVGRGATNRDAAERLYLSPHTVSSHLRHAFAKLRINSRVELARLLHEHDAPAVA